MTGSLFAVNCKCGESVLNRWSKGYCTYSYHCYFLHPKGIETTLEWIDLHPTEYLITMMQSCRKFRQSLNGPVILLKNRELVEKIDFDYVVRTVDFSTVGDYGWSEL